MRIPLAFALVVLANCGTETARVRAQGLGETPTDSYAQALHGAGFDPAKMVENPYHRTGEFRAYDVRREGPIRPPGSYPAGVIVGPTGALTPRGGEWRAFVMGADAARVAEVLVARNTANTLLDPERFHSGPSGSRELDRQFIALPSRETLADGTIRFVYWTGSPPSFQPFQNVFEIPSQGAARFSKHTVSELASPEQLREQRLSHLQNRSDTWTRVHAAKALVKAPDREALPALRGMLSADWEGERMAAVKALRALQDASIASDIAVALMRETKPYNAVEMVDFLGEFRPSTNEPLLKCAREHAIEIIRTRCNWLLVH